MRCCVALSDLDAVGVVEHRQRGLRDRARQDSDQLAQRRQGILDAGDDDVGGRVQVDALAGRVHADVARVQQDVLHQPGELVLLARLSIGIRLALVDAAADLGAVVLLLAHESSPCHCIVELGRHDTPTDAQGHQS